MERVRKKELLAALDASSVEPYVRSFAHELIASKRRRSFPVPGHMVPTGRLQAVMQRRYEHAPNLPIVGWREFVDALNKATCESLSPIGIIHGPYDVTLWMTSNMQQVVGCLVYDDSLPRSTPQPMHPDSPLNTGEWITPPE